MNQSVSGKQCFHCQQPIEADVFRATIHEQEESFCCAGCMGVAQMLTHDGLDNFYQFRDQNLIPPEPLLDKDRAWYRMHDRDDVLERVAEFDRESGHWNIRLGFEGISCAACVWLMEKVIGRLPGVQRFGVNFSNHRGDLSWDPRQIPVSEIFCKLHELGYRPFPFDEGEEQKKIAAEQKTMLFRIGMAGIGTMQNMMLAMPVYLGLLEDSGEDFLNLVRAVGLLITVPVVFFSARPFFQGARRDLASGHLSMDVPVSLAIGIAFAASVYITLIGGEEVYFDSVCMFTFFLLIGRYLESRARLSAARSRQKLYRSTPRLVHRVVNTETELVLLEEVEVGQKLRLIEGDVVPVDGCIVAGTAAINEAAITGEFAALRKAAGDPLLAGSVVQEGQADMEVTQSPSKSGLSVMQDLVERALSQKPALVSLADRVSSYFVAAVLLTSCIVAVSWYFIDAERMFPVVLSVLVATCPCALSLAMPTALTAATHALRESGFIITRAHCLQTLAEARHVIFDKTGTLTEGRYQLDRLQLQSISEHEALDLAKALERDSAHPVAKFFADLSWQGTPIELESRESVTGSGVAATALSGRHQGRRLRLGSAAYARVQADRQAEEDLLPVYLSIDEELVATFYLRDQIRPDAPALIQSLQARNFDCRLLTGDRAAGAARVARLCHIEATESELRPEDKLKRVKGLSGEATTVMVGDGLNDVPAMAAAHLSVAMANASDMATIKADAILLSPRCAVIGQAFEHARKTQKIIRQNICWAIGYNLSILPLAAMGLVPPWVAAIGMSASSLIVVANAMRLNRIGKRQAPEPGVLEFG